MTTTVVPPTAADARGRNHPATVWVRRATLWVLAGLVLLALLTLFGVRSATTEVTGQGYRMSITYPRIARAGLDVPWRVTVAHPGGFGKALTLAVTGSYFDLFESQGMRPSPSSETRDADTYYLTFSAPQGDTFTVYLDTYVQPASQRGSSGTVTLMDGNIPRVTAHFSTWLWP